MRIGIKLLVVLSLALCSSNLWAYQPASTSEIKQFAVASYERVSEELQLGGGRTIGRLAQMIGNNASSHMTTVLKLGYAMDRSNGDPSQFAEMLQSQFNLAPEISAPVGQIANTPLVEAKKPVVNKSLSKASELAAEAPQSKQAKNTTGQTGRGFELGFSVNYLTDTDDLETLFESNMRNDPDLPSRCQIVDVDVSVVPIGLAFRGKKETTYGLRTDFGAGPILLAIGASDNGFCDEADFVHFELPIVVSLGYSLLPRAGISPYVRAGLSYHIAAGDYVEGSKPGLFGAVGLEFNRHASFVWGLEVSVDKSEVEMSNYRTGVNDKLATLGTVVSLFFQF